MWAAVFFFHRRMNQIQEKEKVVTNELTKSDLEIDSDSEGEFDTMIQLLVVCNM